MSGSPVLLRDWPSDQKQPLLNWLSPFRQTWTDGSLEQWVTQLPSTGDTRRLALLLELVKLDLAQRWQAGETPLIEHYLTRYPELEQFPSVFLDLLQAEYGQRRRQGQTVHLEDFLRRFPDRGPELRERFPALRPAAQPGQETPSPRTPVQETAADPRPTLRPLVGVHQRGLTESLGKFLIERPLGRGGMATVYLARDRETNQTVALKVPHHLDGPGEELFRRFQREAATAQKLNHPNICPILEIGCTDGVYYLTMPVIEGISLADYVQKHGALSPKQARALVRKIARIEAIAHDNQVVHRDLKPSNIMLRNDGEPIIMDFGLARQLGPEASRLTRTDAVLGSPAYMAPEQARGEAHRAGPAADIYSLGVILFEVLTGRLPFEGPPGLVMAQLLTQTPPPPSRYRPDLEPALDALCLRALAREPEDRFASMEEFARALKDVASAVAAPLLEIPAEDQAARTQTQVDEVLYAIPDGPETPSMRPSARPPLLIAAAVLLLAGVGYGIYTQWPADDKKGEPEIRITSSDKQREPEKETIPPTGKTPPTMTSPKEMLKPKEMIQPKEMTPPVTAATPPTTPTGPAKSPGDPEPPSVGTMPVPSGIELPLLPENVSPARLPRGWERTSPKYEGKQVGYSLGLKEGGDTIDFGVNSTDDNGNTIFLYTGGRKYADDSMLLSVIIEQPEQLKKEKMAEVVKAAFTEHFGEGGRILSSTEVTFDGLAGNEVHSRQMGTDVRMRYAVDGKRLYILFAGGSNLTAEDTKIFFDSFQRSK